VQQGIVMQEVYRLHSDIQQTFNKIIASGKITRIDQQQFMSALLSQTTINATEKALIDRVFDLLKSGRLKVMD
jgi:hypothetical protein